MYVATDGGETPLYGFGGMDTGKSPTGKSLDKAKKSQPKNTPVTSTGQSAADIVGGWLSWYGQNFSIPVPQSVVARLGKSVRALILTGYRTDDIKWGLTLWTSRQLNDPMLSPLALENLTWSVAREHTGEASRVRNDLKEWLGSLGGSVAKVALDKPNAKQQRESSTRTALDAWKAERAQTGRRVE